MEEHLKYKEARIKLKSLIEFASKTFSMSEREKALNKANEISANLNRLKKEWLVEECITSEKFQNRLKNILNERFSVIVDRNKVVIRVYGGGEINPLPLKEFFAGTSISISQSITNTPQFSVSAHRKKHLFGNGNNTQTNIELEINIDEFVEKEKLLL